MPILQKEHTLIFGEAPWRSLFIGGSGILVACIILTRLSRDPSFTNLAWWWRMLTFWFFSWMVANAYTYLRIGTWRVEINTREGKCRFIHRNWFGKQDTLEEREIKDIKGFQIKEEKSEKGKTLFYLEVIMQDDSVVFLPSTTSKKKSDCEEISKRANSFLRSAGWLSG